MSIESTPAVDDVDKQLIPFPFPSAHWMRALYGVFIVIMPIFAFSVVQILEPSWQSDQLSDYVILLLLPESSWLFFPLLAFSIICYISLLVAPFRFSSSFLVRLGVYTGVLLAFQYSVLTLLYLEISPLFFFVVFAGMVPILVSRYFPKNWGGKFIAVLFVSSMAALYLIFAFLMQDPIMPVYVSPFILALIAPFWSFLLSLNISIWLAKNFETKLTFLGGFELTIWLASYIAAWRFDVLKMYELYAALPTEPPNCYIATAAARGHSRFVRSQLVILSNGKQMWVNPQLQRLKFAELALMAILPRLHKVFRRIYDVLGKALAHRIQHPLFADTAYLLLKPFEWISVKILNWLAIDIAQLASKIYIDPQNN